MKKQTAVEWFFKLLFEEHGGFTFEEIEKGNPKLWEAYLQAKEMERGQIIDAVNFGDTRGKITTYSTSEQYYNETFNNEENGSNTTN
jgi:hypothetical protein